MANADQDRALEAFRRLLKDAADGGQAKVDAIVALSQRTVLVAIWRPGEDGYRTLRSSNGDQALPVFTDQEELEEAARRFGWVNPDGTVSHAEVGARKALRYATTRDVPFVVIDIASEHSLEIGHDEMEPLLKAAKGSAGVYAATGRVEQVMRQRVRGESGPPPAPDLEVGSIGSPRVPADLAVEELRHTPVMNDHGSYGAATNAPSRPPSRPPLPPKRGSDSFASRPEDPPVIKPDPDEDEPSSASYASASLDDGGPLPTEDPDDEGDGLQVFKSRPPASGTAAAVRATFGSGSSVKIVPLAEPPSDELLDALSSKLREFPEVEWASFCNASRGPTNPRPTIGLRVDTSFRERINEIIQGLRQTGDEWGASLDVLLLDDPSVMRTARSEGLAFFPWRRR